MFSKNNKQAGFSLVELMVVVAIIGILASIAIPSVNKYMAKARQTEAKTNLASLYTSQKAFFSEYNTYDSRFQAVGFTPEGGLRYNVGFSVAGVIATGANGFYATIAASDFNAASYCGTGGAYENGCTLLNGADGAAPPAIPANSGGTPSVASTTTATTFSAAAIAVLQSGAGNDVWVINELKLLRNTSLGIR